MWFTRPCKLGNVHLMKKKQETTWKEMLERTWVKFCLLHIHNFEDMHNYSGYHSAKVDTQ